MESVKNDIIKIIYRLISHSDVNGFQDAYYDAHLLLDLFRDCVIIRKSDLKKRFYTVAKPRYIDDYEIYECIAKLEVHTRLAVSKETFDASGSSIDELKNTAESKLINYLEGL